MAILEEAFVQVNRDRTLEISVHRLAPSGAFRVTLLLSPSLPSLIQMPTVVVRLVRHGETNENVQGIMQGQLDTELNDLGRAQAERLAEALESIPFQYAFTSDLRRASEVSTSVERSMLGDNLFLTFDPDSQGCCGVTSRPCPYI